MLQIWYNVTQVWLYRAIKEVDVISVDVSKASDEVWAAKTSWNCLTSVLREGCCLDYSHTCPARVTGVLRKNGISSWVNLTSGVPQGSSRGPVMYLIFVKDFPTMVESTIKSFFVYGTKMCHGTGSVSDCHYFQDLKHTVDCKTLEHDNATLKYDSKTHDHDGAT